ncbi:MAG TPA: sugar ABC transporter permease [Bacilli bacterium]|nr:sugar ABC transporter permease [Bacilli bacterium]
MMEARVKPKKSKLKRLLVIAKKNWVIALLAAPFLVMFAVFFVYPLFYGAYISLFKWNLFDSSASVFVGLENYQKILFGVGEITLWSQYFWNALKNTLIFVVFSVFLLITIPLFIAILLDLEPRFYKLFRVLFFLPTILSVSAVAIIFKWQFDTNNGFVNAFIELFGFDRVSWLNSQPGAWIAILVTTVWWTIGTNTVIFSAGLKEVDKQMYEAAELEGCNYPQVLWYISLPSIRPQMFLAMINTTIASFGIYGQAEILTAGGPDRSTTVMMMVIRGLLTGANAQPGLATAMAILFGLLIMAVGSAQAIYNKKKGAA